VDFELNEDQQAVMAAVERLLAQRAGATRAIALNRDGAYDHALQAALDEGGFGNIARDLATAAGPALLEAALVAEAVARSGGVVAAGVQLLVAPLVCNAPVAGPIALCTREELVRGTPLRYAAHARYLLVLHHDDLRLLPLQPGDFEPVRSSFGYPMGRAATLGRLADSGTSLGATAVARGVDAWRLALAVEAVGTMEAALQHTVDYLKQRRQFGRAIGSFQAVQHRLALCAIQVEASRWLAREAAWLGATTEGAAAAAAFALQAADLVFTETHQLSGAIGFTCEFDLHVWSMRLLALRQELAGVAGARRALVAARWGVAGA